MDSDQLVQRFLDQELSAEERVQFVVRLGRDEALRRRTIALEKLLIGASRLPRPTVPDGFVATVMERTEQREPAWRTLTEALWAPRDLQWNLAGAAAFAVVALLAVGALVARRQTPAPQPSPSTAIANATPTAAATPSAPATVLVRLVVLQPGARMVQVAGDFNQWNPASSPLEQVSTGAWTVTLPLRPGRYEYMFVVDGQQWVADPFAAEHADDGFGARNAVLDVRPLGGA